MSARREKINSERGVAASVTVHEPSRWGTVLGATLLGVALVSVLAYAALNTGSAAPDPLRDAEAAEPGHAVAQSRTSATGQDPAAP